MSEKRKLHTELGISDERMDQIRKQVIEQIQKLRGDDQETDVEFYSQIVMNCSHVPNDMEEAVFIGILIGKALISHELLKIPIIGDLAFTIINEKM